MRISSLVSVHLILAIVISLLLPGVSNAGCNPSDPDDCEPQITEIESDDDSLSDGHACECLRELPPPCPEPEESESPKTDTEDDTETIIE